MVRDNSQRAKVVQILFFCLMAIHAVNAFGNYLQIQLLNRLQMGVYNEEEASNNDIRQQLLAIAILILTILSIVYFIMWFRRAYYNLQLAGGRTNFTEGWAAGAWFVPFLNLVRPYQIMTEIWNDTQSLNYSKAERKSGAIVGVWWTMYLISNIVSSVSARIYTDTETIEGLLDSSWADLWSSSLEIPAAILAVVMVRQAHQFELELSAYQQLPKEEDSENLLGNIVVE